MKTVKEISKATGISVRTLHYYDEIGLFTPTAVSEAGYRLYDDEALERLQQILFFREYDMPLKEIKAIMENPALDKNQILTSQRKMLELKKARLERLIASIDDILKGENKMDFEVFSKEDIEEMFRAQVAVMTPGQKEAVCEKYGDMEHYREFFMENTAGKKAQENFRKIIEWHGSKKEALDAATNPYGQEIVSAYAKRLNGIMKKIADKRGTDVHSFEVKEIVGEYDFVSKQLYRMSDMTKMALAMAGEYRTNPRLKGAHDREFGEGASEYMAQALEAFYG